MVNKGNHAQMAARFRLVKYYNLPRYNPTVGSFTRISPTYLSYLLVLSCWFRGSYLQPLMMILSD